MPREPADPDAGLDADLDEQPVVRPAGSDRPRRPRRRRHLALAALALLGLAVLVGVARGAAGEQAGSPAGDQATDDAGDGAGDEARGDPAAAAVEVLFPSLVAGPAPGEDYPEAAVEAARGVVPGTARLLARDGDLVFWVARDRDGSVCLLVRAGGEPLRIGGACVAPVEAAVHGVGLPEGDGVRAVLLPGGLSRARAAAVVGPGLEEVAPSLWVGRPQTSGS